MEMVLDKKIFFLLFCATTTISWLNCDVQWKVDFTGQLAMISSMDEPRRSTSESQTCTKKKVMVTIQWSAAGLIHCSILNPGKTIRSEKCAQQINDMHQKLQCLQPELVNRMGPILLHYSAQLHITQATLQSWTN